MVRNMAGSQPDRPTFNIRRRHLCNLLFDGINDARRSAGGGLQRNLILAANPHNYPLP